MPVNVFNRVFMSRPIYDVSMSIGIFLISSEEYLSSFIKIYFIISPFSFNFSFIRMALVEFLRKLTIDRESAYFSWSSSSVTDILYKLAFKIFKA